MEWLPVSILFKLCTVIFKSLYYKKRYVLYVSHFHNVNYKAKPDSFSLDIENSMWKMLA